MNIVYLDPARNDLLEIYLHVSSDNESAADRLVDRIQNAVLRLASFPLSAPARPDIAPDARGLPVGKYIVLYRIADRDVQIVRVVHSARDYNELPFPDR